jgi:hypothetical protein
MYVYVVLRRVVGDRSLRRITRPECGVSECDRGISYSRPRLITAVESERWRDRERERQTQTERETERQTERALQPLSHEFQPHNIKNQDLTSK